MRYSLTTCLLAASLWAGAAVTNVTSKLTNPDFAARYAGWFNQAAAKGVAGGFLHQTNANYSGKSGEVYMERYAAPGSKIPNCNMYQHLKGLTPGTYTLVCNAFCGVGSAGSYTPSTGGYLYAQDQETPITGEAGEHRVVFTVGDDGRATVGIKSQNAACNWMAFDRFRLYYNTEINTDSLTARQQIVDAERQQRQAVESAERSAAKVTTYPYVASGITIALLRGIYSLNGTTAREYGVCWSKSSKEPTILDECSTEYFSNKGYLFRLEGLSPATGYWARPYVITTDGKVAYGEVMKFYTERRGNTGYTYDYQAQVESPDQISWDYNINSGMAETVWMYNQLSYLGDFGLSVHYVRGAGAGGGTADCSYGGWMRVSQTTSYQQTGTMLHETNHGVGVGTTSQWYNNPNLRSNTSSGKWLGPRATEMIRLLENNDAAFMQGDGTHMWGGTTSGSLTYGYGINGAQEDSYNPSNQLLYFGNILITHAMHQDGLLATWSSGITASYTFIQDDDRTYYLKAEGERFGFNDRYVGVSHTDVQKLGNIEASLSDIADDPYFQWKVTFDPSRAMYAFKNVGTGTYLYNSSSTTRVQNTAPAADNYFMLLPSREKLVFGDFQTRSFWMVRGNWYDSYAVRAAASTAGDPTLISGATFDPANSGGESQRFLILTRDEAAEAQTAARDVRLERLHEVIDGCNALLDVPVTEGAAGAIARFETTLAAVHNAMPSYTSASEVNGAVSTLLTAVADYLTDCRPGDPSHPADLSFVWENMSLASGLDHWTSTATPASGSDCWEFFEKTFDFYQTTQSDMPSGNYRIIGRAFQRPGTSTDSYNDYITSGIDKVNARLYTVSSGQRSNAAVANIWRDCTNSSLGAGSISKNGKYVPNNMASGAAWFDAGYYTDSLFCTTTGRAPMRLGFSGTTGTSYWFMFHGGMRVLFYGDIAEEDITDTPETGDCRIGSLRYGRISLSGTESSAVSYAQSFEKRKTPHVVLSAPGVSNKTGKFLNLRSNGNTSFSASMTPFVSSEGTPETLSNKESACYLALPKDSTAYSLPSVSDASERLLLQCGNVSGVGAERVHVSFSQPYPDGVIPVVIVTSVKSNTVEYGMTARVDNITSSGFDVRILRQHFYEGKSFTASQVYFFAMQPGEASLGGGLLLSAQRFEDALQPSVLSGERVVLSTPLASPYILFGAQSCNHSVLREVMMGRTDVENAPDGHIYVTSFTPYAYLDETASSSGEAYSPGEDLGFIAVATDPNGNPEDEPTVTAVRSLEATGTAAGATFDAWTEGNVIRASRSDVRVFTAGGQQQSLNMPLPKGLYIVSDGSYSKKLIIE